MKKQFLYAIRFCFVCTLSLSGIAKFQHAAAQITLSGTLYTQNFDSLASGLPTGWSVDTGMTATNPGYDVSSSYFIGAPATNTNWNNSTGRFKNVASATPYAFFADATSASQTAQTNRALGIRQNAALDNNIGFMLKIANTAGFNNFLLSFNLQSLDSNASRTTTWMVDYSIGNNPVSFIPVTATGMMTTGGNQFSKNTITVDFGNALDNKNDTICIRILSLTPTTGSGSRTTSAIDDFSLMWSIMPPPDNMELLSKTPGDTGISIATHLLTLHYDHLIQAGSGQIDLYKAGNAIPASFTVPSAAVTINDSTATVNGIALENNTSYYVLMPAGTFLKQGDSLPNRAITDSAYWTFATVDTTPPVWPSTLDESFSDCTDTTIGIFKQYNVSGFKTWRCTMNGHDDSAAVSMSGGVAAGVSNVNEDWLISAEPFDFSAMSRPILSFWQKRRFEGAVTRNIKISANYIAGTAPDSATWTILQIQDMSHAPDADDWSQVEGIDLTDFKNIPFFLAFTYGCDTGGAYELSYDDIKITDQPLKVGTSLIESIGLKVLGAAHPDRIVLSLDLMTATDLNIQMCDMTGRIIYRKNIKGKAGHQKLLLENTNAIPGMYVIRVMNEREDVAVKVFVR